MAPAFYLKYAVFQRKKSWPRRFDGLEKTKLEPKFHVKRPTTSRMNPTFGNLAKRLPWHFQNSNFLGSWSFRIELECSKNSISWISRAQEYPFFNKEWSRLFLLNFWSSQSFETFKALQKWEGIMSKKTRFISF